MKEVKLKLHTVSGQVVTTTIQDSNISELANYDLDSLIEIPFGRNRIYVNMRNVEYLEVSEV